MVIGSFSLSLFPSRRQPYSFSSFRPCSGKQTRAVGSPPIPLTYQLLSWSTTLSPRHCVESCSKTDREPVERFPPDVSSHLGNKEDFEVHPGVQFRELIDLCEPPEPAFFANFLLKHSIVLDKSHHVFFVVRSVRWSANFVFSSATHYLVFSLLPAQRLVAIRPPTATIPGRIPLRLLTPGSAQYITTGSPWPEQA